MARTARSGKSFSTLWVRPIITLTSDFGLADSYVAAMKAVLVRRCPPARLIDVTHQLPRHDILAGSIALERAVEGFSPAATSRRRPDPPTVHLAVVDPGVGSTRRIIAARINRQWVVCPDNGLITWPARRHGPAKVYQITWRPPRYSDVFHGRDIIAPVAAMLAAGRDIATIGHAIDDPVYLDVAPAAHGREGKVIQLDHFGNAMTNIPYDGIKAKPGATVRINGKVIGRLRRTYSDVAPGEKLALIGSSGLIEIAVRDGSAAKVLKLRVGDAVSIR